MLNFHAFSCLIVKQKNMKKTFFKLTALSMAALFISSCTKTGPAGANGANGATGSSGPVLTGNMEGIVLLYDASGAKQLSPTLQAGDSVTITNSNTAVKLKTVTASNGSYTFNNLTTGTYSMTVSKPGYGTVLVQGVQFAGGGTANRDFELSVMPSNNVSSAQAVDTTVTSAGAGNTAENYIKVRGYVPVSNATTTVIIYTSIPGTSSVSNAIGNFSNYFTTTVNPGVSKFTLNIPTSTFYDLGFTNGGVSTAYFAVYILGGNTSASSYTDYTTGQTVFTAISSMPVNTSALVQ